MSKKANVVIATQSEIEPQPVNVIAENIRVIAAAVKRIEASGLSRRGLCVLLADTPGLSISTCSEVLRALDGLGPKFIVKVVK